MKRSISLVILVVLTSCISLAQKIDDSFFNKVDILLKNNVTQGLVDYENLRKSTLINELIIQIETTDIDDLDETTRKAFLINAYNLQVINLVLRNYPLQSVQDVNGFFERKKIMLAGKKTSLNELEKKQLLKHYKDSRIHFAIVCGAVGCPPITDFAYIPTKLDKQLDQQTKAAINDPNFIRVEGNKIGLSQIFKWYADDFGGGKKEILSFINTYRTTPISTSANVNYYKYDWALNTLSNGIADDTNSMSIQNNASRYIVSSTIKKGAYEIKQFNNLYSQKTGQSNILTDRSSYFTSLISALYGLTDRINVGITTRFRKVRNNKLPSSPLSVFGSDENGNSRSGLTAIGPQVRLALVPSWENFSVQSSYTFAIGDDLTGSNTEPFIDWDGGVWNTQIFNDFSIGNDFSLFAEIDFLWEDIGRDNANRLSIPITLIFSYNPIANLSLYTLAGYSPYFNTDYEKYFRQFGLGSKYQFNPNFELELLYTDFDNTFLHDIGGQAATYNLGLRFNL